MSGSTIFIPFVYHAKYYRNEYEHLLRERHFERELLFFMLACPSKETIADKHAVIAYNGCFTISAEISALVRI